MLSAKRIDEFLSWIKSTADNLATDVIQVITIS